MPKKRVPTPKRQPPDLPNRYNSYNPSAPVTDPRDSEKKPPLTKQRRLLRVVLVMLAALLAVVILFIIWDTRNLSNASGKLFGSSNVFKLLGTQEPATDSNGRINVLLIGYSVDDPGHPAASLTDSLILLSMDRSKNTGYMLSIPRDLYVNIPGFGYAKINEAYKDGGVDLLEKVVSTNFDIQIGYYTLINYAAVKDTVNALGGISLKISSKDPRGLYDPNISKKDGGPLKLSNGVQTLDGQTALNLTRARGDPCGCGKYAYGFAQSDFDRTLHQRQVLTAIKEKLNWRLILTPLKNQQILNALSSNVKTDIPAGSVRAVFGTFNQMPNSSLKSISLRDLNGQNYLSSYFTPYGQQALIPAAGLNDYTSINRAL